MRRKTMATALIGSGPGDGAPTANAALACRAGSSLRQRSGMGSGSVEQSLVAAFFAAPLPELATRLTPSSRTPVAARAELDVDRMQQP
jgi:hypothetical protein